MSFIDLKYIYLLIATSFTLDILKNVYTLGIFQILSLLEVVTFKGRLYG